METESHIYAACAHVMLEVAAKCGAQMFLEPR